MPFFQPLATDFFSPFLLLILNSSIVIISSCVTSIVNLSASSNVWTDSQSVVGEIVAAQLVGCWLTGWQGKGWRSGSLLSRPPWWVNGWRFFIPLSSSTRPSSILVKDDSIQTWSSSRGPGSNRLQQDKRRLIQACLPLFLEVQSSLLGYTQTANDNLHQLIIHSLLLLRVEYGPSHFLGTLLATSGRKKSKFFMLNTYLYYMWWWPWLPSVHLTLDQQYVHYVQDKSYVREPVGRKSVHFSSLSSW